MSSFLTQTSNYLTFFSTYYQFMDNDDFAQIINSIDTDGGEQFISRLLFNLFFSYVKKKCKKCLDNKNLDNELRININKNDFLNEYMSKLLTEMDFFNDDETRMQISLRIVNEIISKCDLSKITDGESLVATILLNRIKLFVPLMINILNNLSGTYSSQLSSIAYLAIIKTVLKGIVKYNTMDYYMSYNDTDIDESDSDSDSDSESDDDTQPTKKRSRDSSIESDKSNKKKKVD